MSNENSEQRKNPNARGLYYIMVSAALAYREMFIGDDIASALSPNPPIRTDYINRKQFDQALEKFDEMKKMGPDLAKKERYLTNRLAKEVEAVKSTMTEKAFQDFNKRVQATIIGVSDICEAKDTRELLTLTKMYNAGQLDSIFSDLKESKHKVEEVVPPENKAKTKIVVGGKDE